MCTINLLAFHTAIHHNRVIITTSYHVFTIMRKVKAVNSICVFSENFGNSKAPEHLISEFHRLHLDIKKLQSLLVPRYNFVVCVDKKSFKFKISISHFRIWRYCTANKSIKNQSHNTSERVTRQEFPLQCVPKSEKGAQRSRFPGDLSNFLVRNV